MHTWLLQPLWPHSKTICRLYTYQSVLIDWLFGKLLKSDCFDPSPAVLELEGWSWLALRCASCKNQVGAVPAIHYRACLKSRPCPICPQISGRLCQDRRDPRHVRAALGLAGDCLSNWPICFSQLPLNTTHLKRLFYLLYLHPFLLWFKVKMSLEIMMFCCLLT